MGQRVAVPDRRVLQVNDRKIDPQGDFVLYWMIAARRTRSNYALDQAIAHATALGKPLVILEALRAGYRWASDRIHHFVFDGMRDNAARCAKATVHYYPYVEPKPGAGAGMIEAWSKRACVVVTDEFPCFFLPRMVAAVAPRLAVALETVDSNGLIPLRAPEREFTVAHSFRRWIHKNFAKHVLDAPEADPFAGLELPVLESLPRALTAKWPRAELAELDSAAFLAALPIDHGVLPAPVAGGANAARRRLAQFLERDLAKYGEERNDPTDDVSSRLSPYLHFGHLSAHEIFAGLVDRESWTPSDVRPEVAGQREGFWGMNADAESFLDEVLTWREIGYNQCITNPAGYDRFESLPDWALQTMEEHAGDPRPHVYTQKQLEAGETYDRLWNASQMQLVHEGRVHNYLRMLWGKKIYEWSRSPRVALEVMTDLNNRYALDGRNPNSYSGIFWVLGRYDRAWGPEREIFGKLRYMSSDNTARKVNVRGYIERYGGARLPQLGLFPT